jgi:hypothetical protein
MQRKTKFCRISHFSPNNELLTRSKSHNYLSFFWFASWSEKLEKMSLKKVRKYFSWASFASTRTKSLYEMTIYSKSNDLLQHKP